MLTQDHLIVASATDLRQLIKEELSIIKKKQPTTEPVPEVVSEWISNRRAIDEFDWSRATFQRHRENGRLPYTKVGKSIFYRRDDINALLENNMRR